VTPDKPAAVSPHSPLTAYVLRGLGNCWMPDAGCWSHCYHLDGRPQPNESIPHSDVFYSLNVLLGLSRVPDRAAIGLDLEAIFEGCVRRLLTLPVRKYAYGMALWSGAELGFALPGDVERPIHAFLKNRDNWRDLKAQDIGILVTGLSAQAKRGRATADTEIVHELFEFLVAHYTCRSALFFDAAHGLRRNFGSFATQTYLTIACYNYHHAFGDERALRLANACARKLMSLQGPLGEWPWFYHVPSGKVVDFYEVYSVHQDGMAPAWLEFAEKQGVTGATDAIITGFNWILGKNQMGESMLRPDLGMVVRSQVRSGELTNKSSRVLRSVFHAYMSPSQGLARPDRLTLRLECRSYHLGWVLWAFAGRDDLEMITHADAFVRVDAAQAAEPR